MMKIFTTALLAVFYWLAPAHAFAETVLTDRYSDAELMQIISDEGYSAVSKIEDGAIRIKINGNVYILFNKDDGDLQTYYAVAGTNISYADINEWNRTKRLSRAYLDSDQDPVLEADLLANGGLTRKHVTEFFRVFQGSVAAFMDFIVEHDQN